MATHAHPGHRRRILRIGVLLGGKIVEERLIRERIDVSLGQSAKNTFSIPIEGLPRQFTIFQLVNERYVLNFTSTMDGRVSDGDRVMTLDVARQGNSMRAGEHWAMPLGDHARGKVTVGELTLLFQFVTEPPMQPRPMLPHSVRGTLADRLEPQLMVCLAISITFHFGFMFWAVFINDPDTGGSMAERAAKASFQEESYEVRDEFILPQEPTETTGETKVEEKAAADKPKPADKPKGGESKPKPEGGGRSENDAVALQEESKAYADMLFSEDQAGTGFSGDMERRKPGSDLGKQLDEVAASGQQTAVGGGTADRGTRGGGPRIGTGTGPAVTGPGGPTSADADGKGAEKVPTGRISVSDKKAFDESSLTPDAVLRKILGAYIGGLKRCHKDLLKTDPTARGKVKLAFTVNESGRTVSPKASGFNSSLDSCIEGLMGNWRFDVPKDGDGEPTEASFEIALQLVPE